jgi:hypothetical protein
VGSLRKAWDGFGVEILVNVGLPYLIYIEAKPGMGRVHALMVSSLPPIAWSAIQLVRKRRVDALSLFVIAGIGLSLLAFLGGGSFRFLELREHLVTALIGLVFIGSVAIKRPLLYELSRAMVERKSREEAEKFQKLSETPRFRRTMTVMTLAIGFLMLFQTAVAIFLVFTLPVREFLIVGPIVSYAFLGALVLGGLMYVKRQRRSAAAARNATDQRVSS